MLSQDAAAQAFDVGPIGSLPRHWVVRLATLRHWDQTRKGFSGSASPSREVNAAGVLTQV